MATVGLIWFISSLLLMLGTYFWDSTGKSQRYYIFSAGTFFLAAIGYFTVIMLSLVMKG